MFFSVNNNFINTIGKTIIGLEEKCLVYEKKKNNARCEKENRQREAIVFGKMKYLMCGVLFC